MMQKTQAIHPIALFCDFHGHSRKKNIFIYGCNHETAIEADRHLEKVFPLYCSGPSLRLLSSKHTAFSFPDCCFEMQKEREATARVVVYKQLGVVNSYTCEASFCGAAEGQYSNVHFNPHLYFVLQERLGTW
jgi:hypothetical protein